jgi:hypothetical protein
MPSHRGFEDISGDDLLSHSLSRAVPSALEALTTVFGTGTGVTPPPLPPEKTAADIVGPWAAIPPNSNS